MSIKIVHPAPPAQKPAVTLEDVPIGQAFKFKSALPEHLAVLNGTVLIRCKYVGGRTDYIYVVSSGEFYPGESHLCREVIKLNATLTYTEE